MPNVIAPGLKALTKVSGGKELSEKEARALNDMVSGVFRKEEEARDTFRKMKQLGLIRTVVVARS